MTEMHIQKPHRYCAHIDVHDKPLITWRRDNRVADRKALVSALEAQAAEDSLLFTFASKPSG